MSSKTEKTREQRLWKTFNLGPSAAEKAEKEGRPPPNLSGHSRAGIDEKAEEDRALKEVFGEVWDD